MSDDRRPLILFVAPYFAPACHGGVVQIYLGLVSRLTRYRVVIVGDYTNTTREDAEAWDAVAQDRYGFTVERMDAFEFHLKSPSPNPFSSLMELVRFLRQGKRQWAELCRRYQPDVIVCGGTYSAGWLMRDIPGSAALVNYVHGEELTMRVKPRVLLPWMRFWQRRCLRQADMNLSVSGYTAQLVARWGGSSPDKSKVLSNFIDLKRFQISGRRGEIRARYGWEDQVILLTVARLEPRKGIDQVLRALALLKKQGKLLKTWKYVIGGKGSEREALVRLTTELGLDEYVEFLGFVPDDSLPGLYESADVFIQPNREIDGDTEGFGVVFLEANACGLPVIGGKAGGTADAIDHGRTGLRVNGASSTEVAHAILILMANTEFRARLSRQGLEWAAKFDVNRAVQRFEDLMDEALSLHASAARQIPSVCTDV